MKMVWISSPQTIKVILNNGIGHGSAGEKGNKPGFEIGTYSLSGDQFPGWKLFGQRFLSSRSIHGSS